MNIVECNATFVEAEVASASESNPSVSKWIFPVVPKDEQPEVLDFCQGLLISRVLLASTLKDTNPQLFLKCLVHSMEKTTNAFDAEIENSQRYVGWAIRQVPADIPYMDKFQYGMEKLIEMLPKFDPTRGVKFYTYVRKGIHNYLLNISGSELGDIVIPADVMRKRSEYLSYVSEYIHTHEGVCPTRKQCLQDLEWKESDYRIATRYSTINNRVIGLDDLLAEEEGDSLSREEKIPGSRHPLQIHTTEHECFNPSLEQQYGLLFQALRNVEETVPNGTHLVELYNKYMPYQKGTVTLEALGKQYGSVSKQAILDKIQHTKGKVMSRLISWARVWPMS